MSSLQASPKYHYAFSYFKNNTQSMCITLDTFPHQNYMKINV